MAKSTQYNGMFKKEVRETWNLLRESQRERIKSEQKWTRYWQKLDRERKEEAKQRKEEAKQRKEEAKQRKEEAKQRKEEALLLERQRKEEAKQRKEEAKQRKEEAKQQRKEEKQRKEEWERQRKETDRKIAELSDLFSNQWGKLVEALAEGSAVQLMKGWGMDHVNRTIANVPGHYKGKDREFDILVINGNEMVVVEAKTTLKQKHVDHFLITMQDFKKYCHEYKALKVYAGVAYIKAGDQVLAYAERKGLFVIRSVGDNALLMNKKNFKPREFP